MNSLFCNFVVLLFNLLPCIAIYYTHEAKNRQIIIQLFLFSEIVLLLIVLKVRIVKWQLNDNSNTISFKKKYIVIQHNFIPSQIQLRLGYLLWKD